MRLLQATNEPGGRILFCRRPLDYPSEMQNDALPSAGAFLFIVVSPGWGLQLCALVIAHPSLETEAVVRQFAIIDSTN